MVCKHISNLCSYNSGAGGIQNLTQSFPLGHPNKLLPLLVVCEDKSGRPLPALRWSKLQQRIKPLTHGGLENQIL